MNIFCWLNGHKFNKEKYRTDMENFYKFNRDLLFKSRNEIENFYSNHPLPYCNRCKKEFKD